MEKELSDNALNTRIPLFLAMFMLVVLITGCAKDGGVCVSTNGPVIQQSRSLPAFNQIELLDNVCLILTNDTGNQVMVEAGEYIIEGIKTEVVDGKLTIMNKNQCNWLRDYSKPKNVYLSGNKIWGIKYNSSGDIRSDDTLKLDSLKVEVWGGCGTIDLSIDVWQGSFSLNMGTVDMHLHGVSAITTVYADDYGFFDARDLRTGYTYITNRGSNDCYVNATNHLEAIIGSIGNIYYSGNPKSINVQIDGSGKVLPY